MSLLTTELGPKRLGLLREVLPKPGTVTPDDRAAFPGTQWGPITNGCENIRESRWATRRQKISMCGRSRQDAGYPGCDNAVLVKDIGHSNLHAEP